MTVHLHWHRLRKGGCITCGYHCIDCPNNAASCKCTAKSPHVFSDDCRLIWCRLHYYPSFPKEHKKYPFEFRLFSSINGWNTVTIYCGPGAYLPQKVKK